MSVTPHPDAVFKFFANDREYIAKRKVTFYELYSPIHWWDLYQVMSNGSLRPVALGLNRQDITDCIFLDLKSNP
jgi:hypothetical protein